MKLVYTLLLGIVLAWAAPAAAQTTSVTITGATGAVGETVCLDLIGENFVRLSGFQFAMTYDTAALQFSSASGNVGGTAVSIIPSASRPGSIRVSWNLFSTTGFTSDPGPFDFGDLCFVIRRPGATTVDIVGTPIPIEFTDDANENVDATTTGGTITGTGATATCRDGVQNGEETGVDCGGPDCPPCAITANCNDGVQNGQETGIDCGGPDCVPCSTQMSNCGAGSDDINFCIAEACEIAVDNEICLDITTNNFTDITSFQFDVEYDGTLLEYSRFFFNMALGDPVQANERSDGEVRLIYFQPSQSGVTLDADAVVATICFTVDADGEAIVSGADLVISDTGGAADGVVNPGRVNGCTTMATCDDGVQNGDETGVDCGGSCAPCVAMPTCDDGVQNGDETGVDCGGSCTPCVTMMSCGEETDDVSFCVGDVCEDAGAEICVPIFVGNFDDLGGFQFSLAFPQANLQYTRFTAADALRDGTDVASPSDGTVNLVWNDINLVGVTFPADEVAFELCFDVENAAATPITFANPDATLRAFDALGSRLDAVGNPGSVNSPGTCSDIDPTCDDGVQNGDETGVDCGGSCEPCMTMPTCDDGIQNGDETGIDCGGSCEPCVTDGGPDRSCGEDTDDLSVCLGTACSIGVGEETCLDITVGNFTAVTSLQFDVTFPAANLTFTRVTTDPAVSDQLLGSNPADGVARIIFFQPAQTGLTLNNGDNLGTVCFTNNSTARTELDVAAILASDTNGEVTDVQGNGGSINGCTVVDPTCDDGIQNGNETGVDCGGDCAPCPPVANPVLDITDAFGAQGQEICVEVLATNLMNVTEVSFGVFYNEDRLALTTVTGDEEALPGLTFTTDETTGQVLIDWSAAQPVTLADGTPILELCFTVTQQCNSTLDFLGAGTGNAPVVNGPGGQPVGDAVETLPGTINRGVPCDTEEPQGNVVLQLGSATGGVGEEVCLDLTATDFSDLTSLSFSLAYDAEVVSFNAAQNFNLEGLTAANITNPSPGVITFDWASADGGGVSVADGTVLVSLCFTVEQLTSTSIDFSNTPTQTTARNSVGDLIQVVPVSGRINTNVPAVDGLTFQIGNGVANVGETVCLPFIGYNLDSLIAFQFSIRYNPDLVEYTGRDPDVIFPLPGAALIINSEPGVIRIIWSDPAVDGDDDLPDGTVLFGLCFQVLQDDVALVSFANTPIPIETQTTQAIVTPTLFNGQINGSQAPAIVDFNVQDPTCSDLSNGSISVFVSGEGDLTYEWTGTDASGPIANNLAAGDYSVTVTNARGERDSMDFTLVAPPPFAIAVADVTNVRCNGENNGSIQLNTLGGSAPFIIDWNGGLPDGVLEQTDLSAGIYSVTITDGNGCTRQRRQIEITEPAAIRIAGTVTPGGDGDMGSAINIAVEGGTGDYDYSWTGPEGFTADTEDLTGLTTIGEYCLEVTDANDCTERQCFMVGSRIAITVVAVNSGCFGENNASIEVAVTGADDETTIEWRNAAGELVGTMLNLTDVAPGTYTLTLNDGVEDVSTTVTIEPATEIMPNATVTNATVGANGSIELNVSGGAGGYTYAWDDGATTPNRDGLAAGEYCVTITDANDCDQEACFTLTGIDFEVTNVQTTTATCSNSDDATIAFDLVGGAAPFVITVEPGGMEVTSDEAAVTLTLGAGTYTINVRDAVQQTTTTMVTVTAPDAIVVAPTVRSNTNANNCTGSVTLAIAGGTAPYTVNWEDGTTAVTRNQLCAGSYSATITDENGCMEVVQVSVVLFSVELTAVTNTSCPDATDGSINVATPTGVTPITYAWRLASGGDVIATTEDLTGVAAGTYELTATDATGAVLVRTYTIASDAGFSIALGEVSNYNGFGVSCNGGSDGTISVVVTGEGTFTYEYLLGDALLGVDSTLVGAAAGTYTIRVMGDSGCEATTTVTLTEPTAVTIDATVTDASCDDVRDGSIAATATGGVSPYAFAWSTGDNGSRITGLAAGDYGLTVTDGNGCTTEQAFTVGEPDDLAFSFETTDATEGCNGSFRVLPLGGSGDFTFTFPELPNQGNNPLAEGLCPGDYTIIVTDENGCQSVTMVATVRDRRAPCLSTREVITPNGDDLNETLVIFCSGEDVAMDNNLQIYNRWGQLVYEAADYDCSDNGGINCFDGRTNDNLLLPEGAYYYVFDYTSPLGEREQQRGSFTLLRD